MTSSNLSPSQTTSNGTGRCRSAWLGTSSLTGAALFCAVAAGVPVHQAQAQSLPSGGVVAAGAASIRTSGNTVTVTQTTDRAVINWADFSVAAGHAAVFEQQSVDSAVLNRVTGNAASTIAGQISSNGSVYLVNPNGIAITASGTVQTGGGFVASTLDIADADFMAGNLRFNGGGASARVTNAGRIDAGSGAYVALLGGAVANSGRIAVPLGKLAMGSGEQVALDLNGGNFLQVAVPTALVTGDQALIDNSGTIVVSGGAAVLKAAVLKDAVRNVVNMSGTINADSAIGDGGTIILLGGADQQNLAGKVSITGQLSARATGADGDGGFIETSGAKIDLNRAQVSTLAAQGKAGTWLIDPVDFTVAANGGDMTGAALSAGLANGNVVILSGQGASGTAGNITINDAVSWSANSLTLDAYGDIRVNAVMNATGTAGFVGIVGDVTQTGVGTAAGNLDFGMDIRGFYGKLNLAGTSSFRLNGQDYVIITSLGNEGSTSGTDLQGITGAVTGGFIRGNYVLGADIDAAATAGWNGGAGFNPIGLNGSGVNEFTGQFNGLGHTVANLTINRPTSGSVGLFASALTPATSGALTATIANLGIAGGTVTGGKTYVGALLGQGTRAALRNVFASADVTGGASQVGGLVGNMSGTITNAFATGDVIGDGIGAGGLAGGFSGTMDRAFATGEVTGCNRVSACYGYGGLIGQLTGNSAVRNVFATGDVAGWRMIGGLVGQVAPSSTQQVSITDSYAKGDAYANDPSFASAGGLIGQGERLSLTRVFASGTVTALAGTWAGGLVGENNGVTIANGYWDTQRTGYTFSCGKVLCSGAAGLTSAESLLAASFSGWDVNGAGSAWRNYEGRSAPLLVALMTPAYIEMTAPNVSTVYNGQDQTAAAGYRVRLLNGADADGNWIYGTAGNSCSGGGCVNAGTYTVTANADLYSDQFGYNLIVNAPLSSTLTITPAALSVTYTANAASGIYGNAPGVLGGSYAASGLVGGDTLASVLQGTASWTTSASATSGVGSYAITGSGLSGSNSNYAITFVQAAGNAAAYTVTPRAITVAANALSRTYGAANPALTYTVGGSGLVNGDSLAGSLATAATSGSNVGSYAITQGTLANANYAITYTGADLTVTPAALTITGNTSSRIYNGLVQTNGFTVSGLVGSDTVTGVSGLGSGRDVGSYADNLSAATGTGLGNYTIAYVNGALTITPAALTITGNSSSRVYTGAAQENGFTVIGLLGADTVTAVSGLASGTNAGSYADSLASATGTGLGNYTIAYVNGGLTITPAALSVTYTANSASGIYGNAPGVLGGSYAASGLVGGDTLASVLQGTASWTTSASATSGVGSYAITGSGLSGSNSNYAITFVQAAGNAAAYTVTPRAITVAANALSRTYGAANPALTYTVGGSGLVNGDSLAGSLATAATSGSNVGSYAITQGTLANANYAITYTGADLTVTPAALTITGNTSSRIYNGQVQTNGFTVSGLVGSDTVTGVSGLGSGRDVGSYADNLSAASGTGLGNYTIAYVNGALTITPAAPQTGLPEFLPAILNGAIAADDSASGPVVLCVPAAVSNALRQDGAVTLNVGGGGCTRN